MIRKKGLLFLAVLTALIVLLSWFFTDSWLEKQLEDMGSSIAGARVEIDQLDFSFTGVYLKWQRLQVTDAKKPMKNLFETGPCAIDFEFWPLLSKKIVVSEFKINGFQTNTSRDTDGSLSASEKEALRENSLARKGASKIRGVAVIKFAEIGRQANTDSLLKIAGLSAPARIDSLYSRLDSLYTLWDKRSAKSNPLPTIKRIEKKIDAIDVNNLKNITKLTKALEQASAAKKSIDKLNKEIQSLKKEYQTDYRSVKADLANVDNWIKNDYNRALSLLKLPDFSAGNIGRMLLGAPLSDRFTEYLGYIRTIRKYARKYKSTAPKKEHPPRLKGQDIYFYTPNARPDFWIKKLHLSGNAADSLKLEGLITNFVSNQKLIGQATQIKLSGSKKNETSLDLEGSFNYLQDSPQEKFRFTYSGFNLNGAGTLLPGKIKSGTGNILALLKINGNHLKSRIDFNAKQLRFAQNGKNEMERLLFQSIAFAERITVRADISGTIEKPEINIHSNLDKPLTAQIKKRFGGKLENERVKINAYIEKQTAAKRKKLEEFAAKRGLKLSSVFTHYEDALRTQAKTLDTLKKKIQKKLTKQKNKLGKDAAKKIKGLF